MSSVTVAVVGAREIAQGLGKKGSQSDLTLYNVVKDGHQATLVEPTQYPEKFPPLLSAIEMADRVVFVVPALNREIAEVAATVELVAPSAAIRLTDAVGEEEFRRALKGSALSEAPMSRFEPAKLREEIDGWNAPPREGSVEVRLDHAFPVKGVGAVALGLVRRGTVHAHDSLRLYPTDRTVEIRSIQVHDLDVREAETGSRVGLALKGIEATELSRGQVLAPSGSLQVADSIGFSGFAKSRYYRGAAAPGQTVHLQFGLQFVPGKIEALEGAAGRVHLDRPVAYSPGDRIVFSDLSAAQGPRIEAIAQADAQGP